MGKNISIICVILVLAMFLYGCNREADNIGVTTITGTVFEADGTTVVQGAVVEIAPIEGSGAATYTGGSITRTVTGSNGVFEVSISDDMISYYAYTSSKKIRVYASKNGLYSETYVYMRKGINQTLSIDLMLDHYEYK